MGMDKVDDELAHPEYWDKRYETTVSGNQISAACSATERSGSDTNDEDESVYSQETDMETYDWFRSWEHLESWLRDNLPPSSTSPRILHLGCGNSVCPLSLVDPH